MSDEHTIKTEHTATASERRKFVVLIVLAGVVIVLFWCATLPFTLRTENGPAGPTTFFQRLGEQFSLTGIIFNKTNEVQQALTEPK